MPRLLADVVERVAGARLKSSPRPLELPADFRGTAFRGEEAARRASRVSGPFSAAPAAYLIPSDEDALAELLQWSWKEGVPLIPRGGGTGMPGGNLGPSIIVEMGCVGREAAMVSPELGLIRAGAGAIVSDLEGIAQENGMFLPFLPSSSPWCQIGGLVSNNGAGARSFRYGSVAASLVGVEGFFAWGEPFRVGVDCKAPPLFKEIEDSLRRDPGMAISKWPKLRKNASGYALDRFLARGDPAQLLAGSEGTLAHITRVEFRAHPRPPALGLAVVAARSPQELTRIALAADLLEAVSCEFMGRRLLELADLSSEPEVERLAKGAYALVFLEGHGNADEVEGFLEKAVALGGAGSDAAVGETAPDAVARLWQLRHGASPMIAREAGLGRISAQFIEDSVVPPDRLGDYLEGLDEILTENGFDAVVFGHAGDGNVHVNPLVDIAAADWRERVRRTLDGVVFLVHSLGGTLSGEHGDGRLRTPFISRIWDPGLVTAFRRVRDALDPRGTLNPGVVIPRVTQDPLEGFHLRPGRYPA